jgi:hypothetical protein
VKAAHQEVTIEWWAGRGRFDLFVSEAVLAGLSPSGLQTARHLHAGRVDCSGGHMIPDPIVEEVRAIRDEIAKEHNYDIDAIFEALRRLDATSVAHHVSLPARRVTDLNQHDPSAGGEAA